MHIATYQPKENVWPGVGIYTELPFASTRENSEPRLQMTADMLGATILSAQRLGTGTTVIDLATRERLHPDNFARTSSDGVKAIVRSGIKDDFDVFIGWFDSGSGATGMGLQLNGNVFDGMLLRNCVNHRAAERPEHPVVGTANFLAYLAVGELRKPRDPEAPTVPWSLPPLWNYIRRIRAEMYHYRPLLLSPYTAQAAQELAVEATLPLRYVDITHTFSGTAAQARDFALRLDTLRVRAAYFQKRQDCTISPAPLLANVEEWYHSDLLRPDHAKRQLEETILFTTGT